MAKDLFHDIVKNALIKDGWTITDDPYKLKLGGVKFEIDLAAEKLIAAEREGNKIAVEIKSFVGKSVIHDFHLAVGQFVNYRIMLHSKEPERILYLAIPESTYNSLFQRSFIQQTLKELNIKLIAYNLIEEVITTWIK